MNIVKDEDSTMQNQNETQQQIIVYILIMRTFKCNSKYTPL